MLSDALLDTLRAICLALPEAVEDNDNSVGTPSFKVRGKIFAMHHPMEGRPSLWCKAPRGMQEVLTDAAPDHYFVPPYVGQHGWVGVWLDGSSPDWSQIDDLITTAYRMIAPKRLLKQIAAPNA